MQNKLKKKKKKNK